MTSPSYSFNPDTGLMEYEDDFTLDDLNPGRTGTNPFADWVDEEKGVGGGRSYTSVGVDPSTLWDPTKGVNWESLKNFITSPQGIAGLGGAALGYLDRPKPSGGGTTMAYPGAAQLQRKMVQGPYGPIAEYTGVGGGAPDYTRFTAPQVEFPTVTPTLTSGGQGGLSMQSKIDQYKMLQGYGLPDDRIRRIAETMYGTQTDADWAELKRLVGGAAGGIGALPTTPPTGALPSMPPAAPPAAPPVSVAPPAAPPAAPPPALQKDPTAIDDARVEERFDPAAFKEKALARLRDERQRSKETPPAPSTPKKPVSPETRQLIMSAAEAGSQLPPGWDSLNAEQKIAYFNARKMRAPTLRSMGVSKDEIDWMRDHGYDYAGKKREPRPTPQFEITKDSSAQEKVADYNRLRGQGFSNAQIRSAADKAFGTQTDEDWTALYRMAKGLPPVKRAGGGITQGYAHGGTVQMEDGGFVLTKRAVDGAGGPRGIQQLVPGARMIHGPGTGTSDDIPATIQGRNGMTPAKVSNGEAYVPKRFVQDQGGPQRMYALMNQLQRKA